MAESLSDRMRLEKYLESLVDAMPTVAVEILAQYAAKLAEAYAEKQREDDGRRQG